MSWTSVAMESVCDISDPGWVNAEAPESACDTADPGWTDAEAPEAACDLAASETLVFNERNHVLDTGFVGSLSGWGGVRMESVCDG